MMGSARTYIIFSAGFATAFIFILLGGPYFYGRSPQMKTLISDPYIPDKPHSHGEFDELMRERGKMPAKSWLDFSEHSHVDEDVMAKQLANKVRIFCWIMTNPSNHKTKAVHLKATWVQRCNKYIFISSVEDSSLPSINVNVAEGRDHLWGKTKAAFTYLYNKELDNYDFFLKADDDTYVVVENLRYMLRKVKPTDPVLFGRKFKPFVHQGYMSGGAGYVISRAGLRLMVEKGFGKHSKCRKDEGGAEDVHFGECAEAVGVIAGDSRDELGRERFHPFPPDAHFRKMDQSNWLWSYNFYPLKTGPECCSDTSVSYHYISPEWMYLLEYFVYHWHPFGVIRDYSDVRRFLAQAAGKPLIESQHSDHEEAQHNNNELSLKSQKTLISALEKERAELKAEILRLKEEKSTNQKKN